MKTHDIRSPQLLLASALLLWLAFQANSIHRKVFGLSGEFWVGFLATVGALAMIAAAFLYASERTRA